MQRLRTLRASQGKTQQQVADALGIDRTTYAKYETGTNEPSLAVLRQLAAYYGTTTDYMLGLSDAPGSSVPLAGLATTGGKPLASLTPEEAAELTRYAKYLIARREEGK